MNEININSKSNKKKVGSGSKGSGHKSKNKKESYNSPAANRFGSSDEYQDLSYKSSKITPVKVIDLVESTEKVDTVIRRKSTGKDFRVKFKTEKCKFYELDQTCKFGDNVI